MILFDWGYYRNPAPARQLHSDCGFVVRMCGN
jgi:hypothetical protein